MPKQMIYPLPNPDGTDADRRVEVGWSRERYVQVATTTLQPGADRDRDFIDGSGTETEPVKPAWDGQFVDLDRHQINELIRTLRRARDQAFGRDE
jgi:hypothetical protein